MTDTVLAVSTDTGPLDLDLLMPPGEGPFPAVLLLPAIAGVNAYVRRTAERLRAAGYATVIVDYYAREGAAPDVSTPEKIGQAVAALSDPRVLADVGGAIDALRSHADIAGAPLGILGFCIGGTYALLSACEHDGLAAAVDYYGMTHYAQTSENKPVSPIDRVPDLGAPILAHFGDFDRLISAENIEAFAAALRENQKNHEVCVYGGAPHAFDEDFREAVYRPVASRDAWARTMAFLDWHLRRIAPR